jgi:hypothetical protein
MKQNKRIDAHTVKGYLGLAVLFAIVLAVGLWAGGFPGDISRYY